MQAHAIRSLSTSFTDRRGGTETSIEDARRNIVRVTLGPAP